MIDDRVGWISRRAYSLWEEAGKPVGRDREHWLQAEQERMQLESGMASEDGAEVMRRAQKARRASSMSRRHPEGEGVAIRSSGQINKRPIGV
jgi:hypothetical protein